MHFVTKELFATFFYQTYLHVDNVIYMTFLNNILVQADIQHIVHSLFSDRVIYMLIR